MEGAVSINSTNIFAVLGSLKKKKTKNKDQTPSKEAHTNNLFGLLLNPLCSFRRKRMKMKLPEDSESDKEGLNDVDDNSEDKHESDFEVPVDAKPVVEKPSQPLIATKETERQLSKWELKKKGLEELEAVLAELGYTQREPCGHDDSHSLEKKEDDQNGVVKENVCGESKSAREKKKKDKSSKEQKELQDQFDGMDV